MYIGIDLLVCFDQTISMSGSPSRAVMKTVTACTCSVSDLQLTCVLRKLPLPDHLYMVSWSLLDVYKVFSIS